MSELQANETQKSWQSREPAEALPSHPTTGGKAGQNTGYLTAVAKEAGMRACVICKVLEEHLCLFRLPPGNKGSILVR